MAMRRQQGRWRQAELSQGRPVFAGHWVSGCNRGHRAQHGARTARMAQHRLRTRHGSTSYQPVNKKTAIENDSGFNIMLGQSPQANPPRLV
ncbi:hypothetical protein EC836_101877 [Erwinia sp. JUb26]|nr:hypothetical protein EC836_101877 [Erwinia sp. JUb26]